VKIAIIELHTHFQNLYSLCKILEKSTHQITIYTLPEIYKDIYEDNFASYNWVLNSHKSRKQFFRINFENINSHDIVLILTADIEYNIAYHKIKKPITILRIHNANNWFNRLRNLRFGPSLLQFYKDVSYILRILLLKTDFIYQKKIKANIDYISFTIENAKKYITENRLYPANKVINPIPTSVYSQNYRQKAKSKKVWITIPGAIDKRRRNYKLLYTTFKNISKKLKKELTLCFLGNSNSDYGNKIIRQFNTLQNNKFKTIFFRNRIPQEKFKKYMQNTNIMLTSMRIETKYKIYNEKYGLTKKAGIESDMVRYGKPAILPSAYNPTENLKPVCLFYTDAKELEKILLSIINHKLLDKLNKKSVKIFSDYTPDKMLQMTNHIFYSLK